jgi:hypothetical protein
MTEKDVRLRNGGVQGTGRRLSFSPAMPTPEKEAKGNGL